MIDLADRIATALREHADADHAEKHRAYHKSSLPFLGAKMPEVRAAARDALKSKPSFDALLSGADRLWANGTWEERQTALLLLSKAAKDLDLSHLSRLKELTLDIEGWALLDVLASEVLGPMALVHGNPLYREVRTWSSHPHLWTRRASILVHLLPARKKALAKELAFDTFEERLFEKEFFIRKAIGWALRECAKHYPEDVYAFLLRVGDRASGLTRREGARRLPERMRQDLGL